MEESPKYPRTPHFSFSPGCTNDDKIQYDLKLLEGNEVVFTEKMDGSNVCLETDACFARTHSGPPSHPSFDAFKQLHAGLKYSIPKGIQVFGEWLYAKHSIGYRELPSHLMIFGIRDFRITGQINNNDDYWWHSWDDVVALAKDLGVPTVPVLARGRFNSKYIEAKVLELAKQPSVCGGEREGLVVRLASNIPDSLFDVGVIKFVRANHVQSSDHWRSQEIVKNGLA